MRDRERQRENEREGVGERRRNIAKLGWGKR